MERYKITADNPPRIQGVILLEGPYIVIKGTEIMTGKESSVRFHYHDKNNIKPDELPRQFKWLISHIGQSISGTFTYSESNSPTFNGITVSFRDEKDGKIKLEHLSWEAEVTSR